MSGGPVTSVEKDGIKYTLWDTSDGSHMVTTMTDDSPRGRLATDAEVAFARAYKKIKDAQRKKKSGSISAKD